MGEPKCVTILGVGWAYEQVDTRSGPKGWWFREVHVNRNGFRLGLNDLPGRTPNPFTTAQTIRVVSGPEIPRGTGIHGGLYILLGKLLEGMTEDTFVGLL